MNELVLSLFPGIGMLDRAFEEEGFCVVRGPDLLWGGDIRRFHPPAGHFDGVIGGPPCQAFSPLAYLQKHLGREPRYGNLIPEFERCVLEAAPAWAVMENVPGAPLPDLGAWYRTHSIILNNRWVAEAPEQKRERRLTFAARYDQPQTASAWKYLDLCLFEAPLIYGVLAGHAPTPGHRARHRPAAPRAVLANPNPVTVKLDRGGRQRPSAPFAVTARHGGRMSWQPQAPGAVTSSDGGASARMTRYSIAEALELQGLPADFLADAPFTVDGKRRVIANGVPLPMGRAVAKAIRKSLQEAP